MLLISASCTTSAQQPDGQPQGTSFCGCAQVMEVQADVRLCTVTEGLTEDAVSARLVQGGLPSLPAAVVLLQSLLTSHRL